MEDTFILKILFILMSFLYHKAKAQSSQFPNPNPLSNFALQNMIGMKFLY